jgi:hypothetical protein
VTSRSKVTVDYKTPHPLYHKGRQAARPSFTFHDEKNETKVGDRVEGHGDAPDQPASSAGASCRCSEGRFAADGAAVTGDRCGRDAFRPRPPRSIEARRPPPSPKGKALISFNH